MKMKSTSLLPRKCCMISTRAHAPENHRHQQQLCMGTNTRRRLVIRGSNLPSDHHQTRNNNTHLQQQQQKQKQQEEEEYQEALSWPSKANYVPPLTPIGFLERAAIAHGNSPSLVYGDKTYTWSDTHARCLKLASSISTLLNGRLGNVVSVLAPNVPAMYELHFAVPMAGAVLNNLNTRLDPRTISVLLRHSGSKILFSDTLSFPLAVKSLSLLPPHLRPILVLISDDHPNYLINNSTVNNIPSNSFYDYEALIQNGDPNFQWIRPASEWDPIVLNYTSGTTSSPKGVVHSHRSAFLITLNALLYWPLPTDAVYLWTLPMFHANGWSFTWGMAAVGALGICLRRVDAPSVFTAITHHRVTHMCAAPVVLNMLINTSTNAHHDHEINGTTTIKLERPVHVMTAGAPPPAAVLSRAEEMGFVVSHGYGLTETGGLAVTCAWKKEWNTLSAAERARLKARQGVRTICMTDMDLIDPDTGKSVNRDGQTVGEVVLRGGCLMLGYLNENDPAETAASCMDDDESDDKGSSSGWFRTGDVGVMHPDGYLEIKDRSKDIIISGGENISSVEVESVLYTHPAVNEAAVVARPDDFWGETPCAFVSLKISYKQLPLPCPSCSTVMIREDELIEYCRAKMPHYMVPKTVIFKDELPKTSTGKIQKFLLRDMAKAMGSPKPAASSPPKATVKSATYHPYLTNITQTYNN